MYTLQIYRWKVMYLGDPIGYWLTIGKFDTTDEALAEASRSSLQTTNEFRLIRGDESWTLDYQDDPSDPDYVIPYWKPSPTLDEMLARLP